jgi:hypothetical protein
MGDFVPIVELGADATFAALRNASYLYDDVIEMRKRWSDRTGSLRSDAVAHEIVARLLHNPVVDTDVLEPLVDASDSAIRRALNDLVERNVVSPIDRGKPGPQRYVAHDVVSALNSFTNRSINPFGRH